MCILDDWISVLSWEGFHTVHGSLARAGKVKSQTPKVEKQEKKKTPKGRAKKRIIYNRRYVLFIPTLIASETYA
jgi:ribosomal protein S30